jgi:hypothetical protein
MPSADHVPPAPERGPSLWVRALLVMTLAGVGLAACSNNGPTSAPASVAPSASAPQAASVTPAVTASAPAAASGAPVPTAAPTGSGAAGSFDACALLATTAVTGILGKGTVVAKPMPGGGWVAGGCAWNGPTSGFFLSVGTAASIAAFGDPAAPTAKAKLAQFKKSAGGTVKDVAGIGDGAVVAASGLAAYKGGTYLEITNLGLIEDQLIEIAKLAVAKL